METLVEAKAHLRENYKSGCTCPACGQYVKEYKRKLNSGMALFLIGLYKLMKRDAKKNPTVQYTQNFYSNKEVMKKMNLTVTSLDYSVMKHFGLIEPRVSEGGKRDSGAWRLTQEGIHFVSNSDTAPKYVYLYNNKRTGISDEQISISEALDSKFDYEELMKAK
jgi:hypothetical protein